MSDKNFLEENNTLQKNTKINRSCFINKLIEFCKTIDNESGLNNQPSHSSSTDKLISKSNIEQFKNQFYELLISEYDYNFGDGLKKYKFRDILYRLFDEWTALNRQWSELQNLKKEELIEKYQSIGCENDYYKEYLEWYEFISVSKLKEINEKTSEIFSLFSPNDIKILEDIL